MRKHKHVVDWKEASDYQKMLNQWETTGIKYEIISEELRFDYQKETMFVLYHLVKLEQN